MSDPIVLGGDSQVAVVGGSSDVVVIAQDARVTAEAERGGLIVGGAADALVVGGQPQEVVTVAGEINTLVVTGGRQGPAGPPGPEGDSAVVKIANGALSGHRAVYADSGTTVAYADAATLAHRDRVLGITTGAAADGAEITVRVFGELVEPSWGWAPGPVWVGTNGQLTQTPPATGFQRIVGFATDATTLFVSLREPITLN